MYIDAGAIDDAESNHFPVHRVFLKTKDVVIKNLTGLVDIRADWFLFLVSGSFDNTDGFLRVRFR